MKNKPFLKTNSKRRVAMFYSFINLFNAWLNTSQLDSHNLPLHSSCWDRMIKV